MITTISFLGSSIAQKNTTNGARLQFIMPLRRMQVNKNYTPHDPWGKIWSRWTANLRCESLKWCMEVDSMRRKMMNKISYGCKRLSLIL
jgi:hypothetical protein